MVIKIVSITGKGMMFQMDEMTEEEASLRVALEKTQRTNNELKRHLEKAKQEVEESYMNVNKVRFLHLPLYLLSKNENLL